MFTDTHCHLSKEDYDNIDEVIERAKVNRVNRLIICGCDKKSIIESIEIANQYDNIYLEIGFHPSEANITTEEDINWLDDLITKNRKVVAVGEIGLDYHYGKENIELQKELFRKQMKLAEELNLPVVIHSRDATEDTINILKEFPQVIGDIHCFSGSVETANIYIKMGYKIGLGGVVTFKNSNLYKVVESIGLDNIILETDAPYLAPVPVRGKKNSSKYVPYIAEKVSEILKCSLEEVAKITTANASTLFDLK